ncbi:hypothetical protein [Bosea sp. R86505]|uniref:hypothetical protein n=1 Tax=Bosea sp. R86505 TaxID=3101710 RepID=UPI00366EFCE5
MSDHDNALKFKEPASQPTLKDRIREHYLAIEEARTRVKPVPWKAILDTLQAAGIAIEPQLLANYICQIRKERRVPTLINQGDEPAHGTRPLKTQAAAPEAGDGNHKPLPPNAGGLRMPPQLH